MMGILTGNKGEPLTTTPSANRTRDGLHFSLAFLAALSKADFRADWNNPPAYFILSIPILNPFRREIEEPCGIASPDFKAHLCRALFHTGLGKCKEAP